MKNDFYIFFSWQSDVKGNTRFIDKKINDAKKEIEALPEMQGCKVSYDHSTQNRAGSPAIADTVHGKINTCDVFIGDVTPIATINGKDADSEKLIPNPNVMAESGFALRAIGANRIILLMRSDKGRIDELPFDIRHRRINTFNLKDKPVLNLKDYILEAIRYSRQFQENAYEQNTVSHDSLIFGRLQALYINEEAFMEVNKNIVNHQRISKWEYDYFDHIEEFLPQYENAFLIPELKEKAKKLKDAIHALTVFTGEKFTPMTSRLEIDPNLDLTPEQEKEASKNSYYSWIDRAAGEFLPDEVYNKRSESIIKGLVSCYEDISEAYREFRQGIKKHLFL